jgi:hypothetical protein
MVGLVHQTSRTTPGWINVRPFIGVRHDEAAEVVAGLGRRGTSTLLPASWYHALKYLDPSIPDSWAFEPPVDPDTVASLCAALKDRGVPILEASTSLEAILAHLRQRHGVDREYVTPVVLALLERKDEARDEIEKGMAIAQNWAPPVRTMFEGYASRFEHWLRTGDLA